MINSTVTWLAFFQRYTKFSVLGHPNPSAKSSPYGSIFYAFHLAGALVNFCFRTMFIFECLTLSRFMGHSVYCCCCICFFFLFLFFFLKATRNLSFHILANRKIGDGGGRVAWVCFEIVWRQSKLNHVHRRSLSRIHRRFIYFPSFFVFVNLPVDIFFCKHVCNGVQVEVQ